VQLDLGPRWIEFESRDIAQVRDTLERTGKAPALLIDPTVDDALAAYQRHSSS
jgi:hypothetical protein